MSKREAVEGAIQVQTPLAVLRLAAEMIAGAAPPAEVPAERWEVLRRELVHARCVECSIKVSGVELFSLAAGEGLTPKLQRLANQYCARNGCESRYYSLAFEPAAGIDWTPVIQSLPVGDYSGGNRERPKGWTISRGVLLRVAAMLIIGIIGLTVFRSWYYGLRIPLIQPEHRYTTNPEPED